MTENESQPDPGENRGREATEAFKGSRSAFDAFALDTGLLGPTAAEPVAPPASPPAAEAPPSSPPASAEGSD